MPPQLYRRAPRTISILAIVLAVGGLAACQPDGGGRVTIRPDSTSSGDNGTERPGGPAADAEAGVIKGRVTTELGAPVAGAAITVVGYTGGSNLGQEIETVRTESDGTYRFEAPDGLYDVRGEGALEFDGATYLFLLDPVDGSCEEQLSKDGIVKDLVLRLRGLMQCPGDGEPDPASMYYYHGATIQLSRALADSRSETAVIEFTLEPTSELADGSTGTTLTMERTVAALRTSAGPIETTWLLHDIPLADYRVSATITEPGGSPEPLYLETDSMTAPAPEVGIEFMPREIVGTLSVGYNIPGLWIYDSP